MTIARWSGQGEGTLVDPFIIDVPSSFNDEEPFYIRMDNNYLAEKNEENYFKLSNSPTVYLLAVVVKDANVNVFYQSKKAIEYTLLLTNRVDYTDGAFIINVYNGVHYILKQQVFNYNEISELEPEDIPRFYIMDLEPIFRKDGDFWFDLELQEGQSDQEFIDSMGVFVIDDPTTLDDVEGMEFTLEEEIIAVDEEIDTFNIESEVIMVNDNYEDFLIEDDYDNEGNFKL